MVAVASVPLSEMKTPEVASTEEFVTTQAVAAAAIAARPRGVLMVVLPGVPELSVNGCVREPPAPAAPFGPGLNLTATGLESLAGGKEHVGRASDRGYGRDVRATAVAARHREHLDPTGGDG